MFDALREGTDPAALGPLGAVLPQLMPMLLRKFNDVPEERLRATIAAMCGKLSEVIAEPADIIEPFRPDVSRETSATPAPSAGVDLVDGFLAVAEFVAEDAAARRELAEDADA